MWTHDAIARGVGLLSGAEELAALGNFIRSATSGRDPLLRHPADDNTEQRPNNHKGMPGGRCVPYEQLLFWFSHMWCG